MFLSAGAPTSASAGPRWGRGGGWCDRNGYGRIYDPSTQETLEGRIERVEYMRPEDGMSRGVHLVLRTGPAGDEGKGEGKAEVATGETITVHLGPSWYLEKQTVPLKKGDRVTIVGSRVRQGEGPILIARTVTKGDEVLELRDETGRPYWAGWRRRSPQ